MCIPELNAISWKKMHLRKLQIYNFHYELHHITIICPGEERRANILRSLQGDYIWIEPISGREFDVAIGARVISAEGRRIQVKDDDNKVFIKYTQRKRLYELRNKISPIFFTVF